MRIVGWIVPSPFLAPFCTQTLSPIPPLLPLDTVRSIYLLPPILHRLYLWTFYIFLFLQQDCQNILLDKALTVIARSNISWMLWSIWKWDGFPKHWRYDPGQFGFWVVFANFLLSFCLKTFAAILCQLLSSTSGQCHHYESSLQALQRPAFNWLDF